MQRIARTTNADPERNWDTLYKIKNITYRTDPRDALLFDMVIEMERNAIEQELFQEAVKKSIMGLKAEIADLKTIMWMRRRYAP